MYWSLKKKQNVTEENVVKFFRKCTDVFENQYVLKFLKNDTEQNVLKFLKNVMEPNVLKF